MLLGTVAGAGDVGAEEVEQKMRLGVQLRKEIQRRCL